MWKRHATKSKEGVSMTVRRIGKLSFLLSVLCCLVILILSVGPAEAEYATLGIVYSGNDEVDLVAGAFYPPWVYRAELLKDGTFWKTITLDGYTYVSYSFNDSGLTKGSSHTYELQIICNLPAGCSSSSYNQVVERRTDTAVLGQVKGMIYGNKVWGGGSWSLAGDIYIQDNASLSITSGTIVGSQSGHIIFLERGGSADVDGAVVSGGWLDIETPGATARGLTIRNTTVEATGVLWVNLNSAMTSPFVFEANLGSGGCNVQYVHSTAGATIKNNYLPACHLKVWPEQGGDLAIEENTFGNITFRGGFGNPYGREAVIRKNTIGDQILVYPHYNVSTAQLRVEENQAQRITFSTSGATGFAGFPAVTSIISNTVTQSISVKRDDTNMALGKLVVTGNRGGYSLGVDGWKGAPTDPSLTRTISGNTGVTSLLLNGTSHATVEENLIGSVTFPWYGIMLADATDNVVTRNSLTYTGTITTSVGIHLDKSGTAPLNLNNRVSENVVKNWGRGIYLREGQGNVIQGNRILGSGTTYLLGGYQAGNRLINNLSVPKEGGGHFAVEACSLGNCGNTWNDAKGPGPNIVGGPYLGGNYWAGYWSEDTDEDYLGEDPFVLNDSNRDELPLLLKLIINSLEDSRDADTSDGICSTGTVLPSGIPECTLRAAMEQVNACGKSRVTFEIPGDPPFPIIPASPLPIMEKPIVLDATTQSGTGGIPLVVLSGELAGATANGLHLKGSESSVRALNIIKFGGHGIVLEGGGSSRITESFIGTDNTGRKEYDIVDGWYFNKGFGIHILNSPNNSVGGPGAVDGNIISNNLGSGVHITGVGSSGNTVQGNIIGTDTTGTTTFLITYQDGYYTLLTGQAHGVFVDGAPGNTIKGNLISANNISGIKLAGAQATGNVIEGNRIGVMAEEDRDLGNMRFGILIDEAASSNMIGGTSEEKGNIIAYNGLGGVVVLSGTGNTIRFNSIYSNGHLGIDLTSDDMVTRNDNQDPDSGANNVQNSPLINDTVINEQRVALGSLNSTPGTTFTIDFYSYRRDSPTDIDEGKTFIGTQTVTTDATGNVQFAFIVPGSVPSDYFVSATATDPNGNTSEFSQPAAIIVNTTVDESDADPNDGICDVDIVMPGLQCTLRAAIEVANARPGRDMITFDIPGGGIPEISPQSKLPFIVGDLIIDGRTQAGGWVKLNGSQAGPGAHGFDVAGPGVLVSGLKIERFGGDGIYSTSDVGTGVIEIMNNDGYGIFVEGGRVDIGNQSVVITSTIQGNKHGGIRTTGGGVGAYFLEVIGNGFEPPEGTSGSGIVSGSKTGLEMVKVNQNHGAGIISLGELGISGPSNHVVGNGKTGIEAYQSVYVNEGAVNVSDNGGYGIYSRGEEIRIGQPWVPYRNYVNRNVSGGIRTTKGGVMAFNLEVVGNGETPPQGTSGSGIVSMSSTYLENVRVNDNHGAGIISMDLLTVTGPENEVLRNGKTGIESYRGFNTIEGAVNVSDNGGWGIYNHAEHVRIGRSWSSQWSYVNRNPYGGIHGGNGSITAFLLEIAGNGSRPLPGTRGDGLYSRDSIYLDQTKVNDNKGVGILGNKSVTVYGSSNEVTGNGKIGIAANGNVIAEHIAVTGNGVGIKAKGNVTINGGTVCGNPGGDLSAGGQVTITGGTSCDADGDGVSDTAETGDRNNDGTPDNQQGNVASLLSVESGSSVTIESPANQPVLQVANSDTSLMDTEPPVLEVRGPQSVTENPSPKGIIMPVGLFDFTVTNVPQGGSSVVKLLLPEGVSASTFYMYGPTLDNPEAHWFEFPYDGMTGAEIQGGVVTLHLTDGARGDNDGTVNGMVSVSGGPARLYTGPMVRLSLGRGWNFISTPVESTITGIRWALSDILGNLRTVWGFSNERKQWLWFKPESYDTTVTDFQSGQGYWLYLDNPATLTVAGQAPSTSVSLTQGWNLVGYLGGDQLGVAEALQSLDGKWLLLWTWDSAAGWKMRSSQDGFSAPSYPQISVMEQGRAYWLLMKEPGLWTQ
jgi:CSLREA domain-containing protein